MVRPFEVAIAACLWTFVVGQMGVTDCALPCIANVNGTSCAPTEWPCLCPSSFYIDRMNACVYQTCTDVGSQQATFGAITNICQVFGFPLTASAEVNTASTMDLSGTVSALEVPTVATIPLASGTSTSGVTMPTGTNTPPTTPSSSNNNATSASSTAVVISGSSGTGLSTSSSGAVSKNSTLSPSAASSSAAAATFTGAASLVSIGQYAAWGGALAGGLVVRYI